MAWLRIGLVAPPWVAVPPPRYGGSELVIDGLARGLVAAGHEVVLVASGDSTCPVARRSTVPVALGTTAPLIAELPHVEAAYAALRGRVDIVHDHTLLGPMFAATTGVAEPVVTTAHGPFTPELTALYAAVAHRSAVVAISRAQRASAPSVPVRAVIHHGIDVERYPGGAGAGGYVVFLGRMHPDKGPDRAIRAARRAGLPIRLAAKIWEPVERAFYREVVEPLLGPDAEYVGEVGGGAKAELLAGAAALLNPIRWPEPFGLVMIEAMACGTPVISFPSGSAPEVVDEGVTGFLCADEDAMVEAIGRVDTIDRARCRRVAATRFGTARMVADHASLYRSVLAGERSAAAIDIRIAGAADDPAPPVATAAPGA